MLDQPTIEDLGYQIALRVKQLEEAERQAEGPPPELLYHYTTANGMVGVVDTGELWATNVLYLNDKSELSNASDFFRRELDEQGLGLADSVDFLRLLIHTQFEQSDVEHFSVSFCEGSDLLEQWRAYGGSGSGHALGFRPSALTPSVFGAIPSVWVLRKVRYTESAKRRLVQDRLAIVKEILAFWCRTEPCERQ